MTCSVMYNFVCSVYFAVGDSALTMLTVCAATLIYSLGCTRGILVNSVTTFLSSVNFEIYLCYMVFK